MVDLSMKSDIVEVVKINRKTRAKVLENIEVGDRLRLTGSGRRRKQSGGRSYAVGVKIVNLTKGEHTYKTFNTLSVLDAFELEKVVSNYEE